MHAPQSNILPFELDREEGKGELSSFFFYIKKHACIRTQLSDMLLGAFKHCDFIDQSKSIANLMNMHTYTAFITGILSLIDDAISSRRCISSLFCSALSIALIALSGKLIDAHRNILQIYPGRLLLHSRASMGGNEIAASTSKKYSGRSGEENITRVRDAHVVLR